jgi:predicted amidophosphoribosyltransferase
VLLPTRCPLCSVPAAGVCPACAGALVAPAGAPFPACFAYAGAGRSVVAALKYRNARAVAPWVAGRLAGVVERDLAGEPVGVVTWAPTGVDRRRHRGFDQGELLARALGRELHRPVRRLLARPIGRGPQTGRSRAQRLNGPAFVAHRSVVAAHVLVVDDVVTTGATLRAARRALIAAGAASVRCVAVAATAPIH